MNLKTLLVTSVQTLICTPKTTAAQELHEQVPPLAEAAHALADYPLDKLLETVDEIRLPRGLTGNQISKSLDNIYGGFTSPNRKFEMVNLVLIKTKQ